MRRAPFPSYRDDLVCLHSRRAAAGAGTGAGANARASIGITVFTGMLASTCLAVLFVPSFFVMVQRFEEWRIARKKGVVAAG